MKIEYVIRVLAGGMVLLGLLLGEVAHPYWRLLSAFVGLNLIQSAFTGFCPAERIVKKLGIGKGQSCCPPR